MIDLSAFNIDAYAITRRLIIIISILIITHITARVFRKIIEKAFNKSSRILKVDKTQYAFLKHTISALVYVIGIGIAVYTIPSFRTFAVSLLAGAGILAVIIGFASQQAFSNVISGVFIAIFKPFRVGDLIKIDANTFGKVEDITLRHTVLKTFENKRLIIPNSKISEQTIENANIGDEKICKFVEFGISYDSDIDKAMKIMREEAEKHPNLIDNRDEEDKKKKEPKVRVKVISFGDSSVNLRAWCWAKKPKDAFEMAWDLNRSIKLRFDKEGIEIPFPHRTIVYKTDIMKELRKKNKRKRVKK